MKQARFICTLITRRLNRFPGDSALRLLRSAVDVGGTIYPRGTVVQPLCGGFHNGLGSNYCDVTIIGGEP